MDPRVLVGVYLRLADLTTVDQAAVLRRRCVRRTPQRRPACRRRVVGQLLGAAAELVAAVVGLRGPAGITLLDEGAAVDRCDRIVGHRRRYGDTAGKEHGGGSGT